jgi:tRNA 2-thiouridine synthesizing protein A
MSEKIDVRGLSCPLPVVAVRNKLLEMKKGILEVLVDIGTSKDNITRMATNTDWKVEVKEEGEEYLLTISK